MSVSLLHTCAYQGVRNVNFSENFAYVLNGWSLIYWTIRNVWFWKKCWVSITNILVFQSAVKRCWFKWNIGQSCITYTYCTCFLQFSDLYCTWFFAIFSPLNSGKQKLVNLFKFTGMHFACYSISCCLY